MILFNESARRCRWRRRCYHCYWSDVAMSTFVHITVIIVLYTLLEKRAVRPTHKNSSSFHFSLSFLANTITCSSINQKKRLKKLWALSFPERESRFETNWYDVEFSTWKSFFYWINPTICEEIGWHEDTMRLKLKAHWPDRCGISFHPANSKRKHTHTIFYRQWVCNWKSIMRLPYFVFGKFSNATDDDGLHRILQCTENSSTKNHKIQYLFQ